MNKFRAVAMMLVLYLGALSASDVLVKNGGFNEPLKVWMSWINGGQLKEDATGAYMEFTGAPEQKTHGVTQARLPLQPDKTYRLWIDLKTTAEFQARAALLERGERNKVLTQHYRNLPLRRTGEWETLSADFTTSKNDCGNYQLVIRFDKLPDGAQVALTNVRLSVLDLNPLLERNPAKISDPALMKRIQEEASRYGRRSDKTAVFSRAQLKYGLERRDYYHKWVDRPLLGDPEFALNGGGFLKTDCYKVMARTVKDYKMAGLAFMPETRNRPALYDSCKMPGYEMQILTEFAFAPAETDLSEKISLARLALENPQSCRLNGKVVITSYPGSDDTEYWAGIKKALTDALGDHFIFMPYYSFYPQKFRFTGPDGSHSAADVEMLRSRLRAWLRVVDGVYYNTPGLKNRRYFPELDREIIMPIIHSVLMEPEFENKFLAWGTKVGHENYEALGYSFDSAGTGMLRGTMETALLSRADIINCIEWDEQNENTSFRPTVCNSFSTMRIIRYFADKANGRPLEPVAGDDLSVPNLILSYRKIIEAGRKMEFELVNVPDSNAAGEHRVVLSLLDLAGKTVHRFPEQVLRRGELDAVMLELPSEELLTHHVLIPELTVDGQRFDRGFQPLELRASWNWDFKWVKQPLRDLLKVNHAGTGLKITGRLPDGTLELTGTIEAEDDLAYIEVMDGGDVVYTHSEGFQWRETPETVLINVNFQAALNAGVMLNGTIRWRHAPSLRARTQLAFNHAQSDSYQVKSALKLTKDQWRFEDLTVGAINQQIFAAIDRKEAENAIFEIDLPGVFQGELKVADILKREVTAFPAPGIFNLVFRRYNSQLELPEQWRKRQAEFKILVRPAMPNSLFCLQAVGCNGKTWRGAPVSLYRPAGQAAELEVYSEFHGRKAKLPVDKQLLTTLEYEFSPERGTVFFTGAGREFLGIGGGYTPQVTGRGSGESAYGTPLRNTLSAKLTANRNAAPAWIRENDAWVMELTQPAFVSMPRTLVPVFAGFELEIEVCPASLNGTQTILGSNATGFMLNLQNGVPQASFYQNNHYEKYARNPLVTASGPPLRQGQWATLKVRFDQETLTVSVDGVKGKPEAACGYARYTVVFGLGVNSNHPQRADFFEGKIRKLVIRHYNPENEK